MSISIAEAAQQARQQFPDPASATLEAQLLLCRVLKVERSYLLAHPEDALEDDQANAFAALVARRAAGEPLAYIVGQQAFYQRNFRVTPDVLIPRPETELLVEAALAHLRQQRAPIVADIGTGSGAIAISIAAQVPQAQVWALDVSLPALAVARLNGDGLPNLHFAQGDLAQPLIALNLRVDVLCANLPYIPDATVPTLDVSKYEPHLALAGGADGLGLIRRLLAQARQVCHPGALLLLEIGAGQGASALQAAAELCQPRQAEILLDYADHDRLLRAWL